MLSIIVPVLDEAAMLPTFLRRVDAWGGEDEVIFCDGGSRDGTLELLAGRLVVKGPRGRGEQCQAGIENCHGDGIVLLHVDTFIGAGGLASIRGALDNGATWGCLTLAFDCDAWRYRLGAMASNARVKLTGIPFGDQCMFMTREALDRVGGVPRMPIMEDYELSRRLRQENGWPLQLVDEACTSARRFESGNPYLIGLQMRKLRSMYRKGASIEWLADRYRAMGSADCHAIE